MIECMDNGVIDWGVDHIQARKLQEAWELMFDAYADGDVERVEYAGKVLISRMIDVIAMRDYPDLGYAHAF